MKYASMAVFAATLSLPVMASAQNFEALLIGNGDQNGSTFYMLSLRSDLGFGKPVGVTGNERNASDGLRLRFDLARSTYDTNYNNVPGTGTGDTYRLLLSYGIPVDESTTVTLTGGVSYHSLTVRPVTANSPDDSSETAEFISVDLEHSPSNFGTLQALAEHDGAGADYLSASYLFNASPSLRVGPTANYIVQGDYSRTAFGLSAVYQLGDQFEIKGTAAKAEQTVGKGPAVDVDYFEVQLRTVF
ncbi:MAG: hypothetical protein A3D16_17630 [Rhodobacterales bacterium RIFCSPHIGHO2_02_FULL_62_130]|nr:MAG: hypothetical protein A3D16_17630 [Rhodobacterales bacterium RIFCSPHIGHO2_02_FULL_62_130]